MSEYWLGVLTPFLLAFGVLLLWLASNLFGALISWAWKKAHYGLLKKAVVPVGWDKEAKRPSVRPEAEKLANALTASGEYWIFPLFGWVVLIVRDHKKKETKDEHEL